jgi:hypothetical protein
MSWRRIVFAFMVVVAIVCCVLFVRRRVLIAQREALNGVVQEGLWASRMLVKNYSNRHHEFPPTHFRQFKGAHEFSWRLAALEEFGETDMQVKSILSDIDTNQPWDSEKNRRVTTRIEAFRLTLFTAYYSKNAHVNVCAVVGNRSVWREFEKRSEDVFDNEGEKLMFAAIPSMNYPLFEPRDLTEDELNQIVNEGGTVWAVRVDGTMFDWNDLEVALLRPIR